MAADDLPADLIELKRQVSLLPIEFRGGVAEALSHVEGSVMRRRRILSLVQEALQQIRMDMKYIMFDLEATKRERDELRNRNA